MMASCCPCSFTYTTQAPRQHHKVVHVNMQVKYEVANSVRWESRFHATLSVMANNIDFYWLTLAIETTTIFLLFGEDLMLCLLGILRALLQFSASLGSLIFFDEEKLRDSVVLDPYWLAEAGRLFISEFLVRKDNKAMYNVKPCKAYRKPICKAQSQSFTLGLHRLLPTSSIVHGSSKAVWHLQGRFWKRWFANVFFFVFFIFSYVFHIFNMFYSRGARSQDKTSQCSVIVCTTWMTMKLTKFHALQCLGENLWTPTLFIFISQ